ncbi:MAG TPA: DMT family transporter [Thermoleophilaceae bacterium]
MRRHTFGSLLIASCALSWGFIGIVVREIALPPLLIVFFAALLSAAAIAAFLALTGRRRRLRPPGRPVLILGLLLGGHWCSYFAAINETSVASAVLVTYAGPVIMALIAPALIGERVPSVTVGALAVSVAGIAAISLSGSSGGVHLLGGLLALVAAITFALQVVMLKRYTLEMDPLSVQLWESIVVAIALAPVAILTSWSLHGSDVGYIVLLGIVLTGFTGAIYIASLRWVAVTTAGILGYLEPVTAAIFASLLLGQELTVAVIIGGVAIVASGIAVVVKAAEPVAVR